MTTVVLPPDPATVVTTALRWTYRNDLDLAERYLRTVSEVDLAEARHHLLRLALLIQSLTPEGVAAAALAPDSLGGEL